MKIQTHHVRWVGKEVVSCRVGDLSCEVPCYYDAIHKTFTVVLGPLGIKSGRPWQLTDPEPAQLEKVLINELGVKRFLGVAIGRREVYVQREQHVF